MLQPYSTCELFAVHVIILRIIDNNRVQCAESFVTAHPCFNEVCGTVRLSRSECAETSCAETYVAVDRNCFRPKHPGPAQYVHIIAQRPWRKLLMGASEIHKSSTVS